MTVKSGSFGTAKGDHTSGIYVGGRGGGTQTMARSAKVEGGYIYNLIGGPISATTRGTVNDIYIYQTGGTIDMVIGGAGTTATYGNRIVSLTGGMVGYSAFGGSNGYNAGTGDGMITGSSFIYVGGNVQVGNPTYVTGNSNLFGAEAGSVFGIGNGNEASSNIGSCDNSTIIIDGNADVLRNVYGGGNYGGVASTTSTTLLTPQTKINVLSGKIRGDIYGAGNRAGSGNTTRISTITINMSGGQVLGNIYGGSNITGTVYGTTNINVLEGLVGKNVYGGGKGGVGSTGNFIARNVNVIIGSSTQSPNINGNVYGGSAFGSVNGTANSATLSGYTTNVTVHNGNILGAVFGGAEGNTTYTPYVMGPVTVNINGGDIGYVYGGNDQAGVPNGTGTVLVYLNGGIIGESYGGGNRVRVPVTKIYLQGSETGLLFGGSNVLGNIDETNVMVTSRNSIPCVWRK